MLSQCFWNIYLFLPLNLCFIRLPLILFEQLKEIWLWGAPLGAEVTGWDAAFPTLPLIDIQIFFCLTFIHFAWPKIIPIIILVLVHGFGRQSAIWYPRTPPRRRGNGSNWCGVIDLRSPCTLVIFVHIEIQSCLLCVSSLIRVNGMCCLETPDVMRRVLRSTMSRIP